MFDVPLIPDLALDAVADPAFADMLSALLDIKTCFSISIFLISIVIGLLLVLVFTTLWGG